MPSSGSWRNAGIVSPTECWTLSTSEFPSDVEESSLLDISVVLETIVPSEVLFDGEGGVWNTPPRRPAKCLRSSNAALTLSCGSAATEQHRLPASERDARKRRETLLIDGD